MKIYNYIANIKWIVPVLQFLFLSQSVLGQTVSNEKLRAKASIVDEQTIKIRWAPANPRTWVDGRKYGYILQRYTLMVDSVYQQTPAKSLGDLPIKAAPLARWENHALQSDYAAVIAQALYGDDFALTSSQSNVGSIINQANELEQRFATSVFMAEYDYTAAELAGWAYTDKNTRKNEQYLYRIILNRPVKQQGDTTALFMGYTDKKLLPPALNVDAIWGDKSVMLSWNYQLLSDTYHSYHVERKASGENAFKRITNLPITAFGENRQQIFYTDSLPQNNTPYSYRVIGITTFDEEGPASEEVTGEGKRSVSCVPNIFNAYFTSENKAHLFWSFDCPDTQSFQKFVVKRAVLPDGEYTVVLDSIPLDARDIELDLMHKTNYVKLFAVTKDNTETASFPFSLNQVDSIPPLVPTGLRVEIDSVAVAHLSWDANSETDLRGYRILRSFTADAEKSSIVSDFVTGTQFTDSLSLTLGNEKVYYSLTALDLNYNESAPCLHVAATKPNLATPALPSIISYQLINDNSVSLSWVTDTLRTDIRYSLHRVRNNDWNDYKMLLNTDANTTTYTDEVSQSGDYSYQVVARDANGKESLAPQKLEVSLSVNTKPDEVANFSTYVDRTNAYIELSWNKHPMAVRYRLYKQVGDKSLFLWKETDASNTRIADDMVSPNTAYSYTIVYINEAGRMSQAKTIQVNY
jgi:fibronectin type 3 domain-containing protein